MNEPDASRFVDEDFNRVGSTSALRSDLDSLELRGARELRSFIHTVEFLLDVHSFHEASEALMISGSPLKRQCFTTDLGFPE